MAQVDEEQVMDEAYKTEHEILEAARRKFLEAIDHEKEAEEHKDRMKDAQKRADAARGEAEALVMRRRSPQMSIPLAEGTDPERCSASEDGVHEWGRIRIMDGVAFEDCEKCGLERTGRVEDEDGNEIEDPSWGYSVKQPAAPAEESANV